MSIQTHNCVTIHCDGCKATYKGYEDEFIVHFDNAGAFTEEQKDYEGESNHWTVDGDKHYCPDCACERETGHALTEEIGTARYCRCGSKWDRGV